MKTKWMRKLCGIMALCVLLQTPFQAYAEELDTEDIDTQDTQMQTFSQDEEDDAADVSGSISVEGQGSDSKTVAGDIVVEKDENDDNVEITSKDKPYLSLGANLTEDQRVTVLRLLGVDSTKLEDYDVSYVTNDEEHQYLDSYIDSSKIGTKSLSSVVIVKREAGSGIHISTNNISYCTVGMYKNALATAGIQDADIIVAGPFALSGTAALVGVFKAYQDMTGETVAENQMDTALNEIVVTGDLKEATGKDADTIEGMVAYIKQSVVEKGLDDADSIKSAIEEGCSEFDVSLTEEQKEELTALMMKISDLDLDVDTLKQQAQSVYNKISELNDAGVFDGIKSFFQKLFDKLKEWVSGNGN